MCGKDSSTLLFDFDFDKTERALRKAIREAVVVAFRSLSDFTSDKELGDME